MQALRFCCASALLLTIATPVWAVITTLGTDGDTYLQGSNQNRGTDTFLRIRANGDVRTLVQFDQSAIEAAAAGGVVASAQLELFIEFNNNSWGDGREVDVHRVTTEWTELGATPNCPIDTNTGNSNPDCAVQWNNGDFDATPSATLLQANGVTGAVQFDVTADVVAFLNGTDNYGWLVKKRNEGQGGVVEYTSREGTANQEAKLILDVAPPTETPTNTPTETPTSTPTDTPTNTFTATATFTPNNVCGPEPIVGCRQSIDDNKSLLLIKDRDGVLKDQVKFRWVKGEATDKSVFGDPVAATTYTLCIYDEIAGSPSLALEAIVPPGGTCNNRDCWKETKKGFRYKDVTTANDGIKTISMKSGTNGKSKIVLKGQSLNLDLPPLPLEQDQKVIVQLKNDFDGGQCFEARFSGPPKRNQSDIFKDKNDPPLTFVPTDTPTLPATPTFTATSTFTPTATPVGSVSTATPTDTPQPTATSTPTPTGPTATPTDTPEGGAVCGNNVLEPGEFVIDGVGGQVGDPNGLECAAESQVLACTADALNQATYDVILESLPATFPDTVQLAIGYRSDLVSFPGSGPLPPPVALQRITLPPPLPSAFGASDFDYALRILIGRSTALEPLLFSVTFDGCLGEPGPIVSDLACIVEGCAGGGVPIDGCTCSLVEP